MKSKYLALFLALVVCALAMLPETAEARSFWDGRMGNFDLLWWARR